MQETVCSQHCKMFIRSISYLQNGAHQYEELKHLSDLNSVA